MVLTQKSTHTYPYSWDVVSHAFWNKYPHPKLTHVKRIEVLDRYIDHKTGRLHSSRLTYLNDRIPKWVEAIVGKTPPMGYEETICDPKTKTLLLKTRNLSFRRLATFEEHCVYQASDENPNQTDYTCEMRVSAFVPFMSQNLESFSLAKGTDKAKKGLKAMEELCMDVLSARNANVLCEGRGESNMKKTHVEMCPQDS